MLDEFGPRLRWFCLTAAICEDPAEYFLGHGDVLAVVGADELLTIELLADIVPDQSSRERASCQRWRDSLRRISRHSAARCVRYSGRLTVSPFIRRTRWGFSASSKSCAATSEGRQQHISKTRKSASAHGLEAERAGNHANLSIGRVVQDHEAAVLVPLVV